MCSDDPAVAAVEVMEEADAAPASRGRWRGHGARRGGTRRLREGLDGEAAVAAMRGDGRRDGARGDAAGRDGGWKAMEGGR